MSRVYRKRTLTKKLTRNLLIVGTIGGFMPYILSVFEREPVEQLGIAWVSGVVGIVLGYFVRGYKDTKAECEHDLSEREFERRIDGE